MVTNAVRVLRVEIEVLRELSAKSDSDPSQGPDQRDVINKAGSTRR